MHETAGTSSQDEAYKHRLNESRRAKEEGNTAMVNNKPKEASFHYKKACLFLAEYVPSTVSFEGDAFVKMLTSQRTATRHPLSEERTAEVLELYVALQNNLALAHLQLCRYAEGVRCATSVLSLPGYDGNLKALFRRASCNMKLGMLEEAEADLNMLERHTRAKGVPLEDAAILLRKSIAAAKKKSMERQQEMCKKMFQL